MPDIFTKAKRSEVMSRIHSRGNKDTELALARLLRANGITGWRRHLLIRATVEQSSLRSAPPRSRWLKVERRKRGNTSSGLRPPSPQSGEGAALVRRGTPQPSTTSRAEAVRRRISPQLTVRPDFVFQKSRTAVFVDGCFWHGCPKHATWPAHRAAWWRRKIEGNKTRDRVVNRTLRRVGWRVLRIWEHELARKNEAQLARRILRELNR